MKFRNSTKRNVRIKYILFNYKGIDGYLPMIHVCLKHKGLDIQSTALIDSGATSTFVPLEMAKLLDITLENPNNNVSGVGGKLQSYLTSIGKISVIKGQTLLSEFTNMGIRVPTKDDGIPFIILGRDSIFLKYDIKFQESLSQIQLLKKKSN